MGTPVYSTVTKFRKSSCYKPTMLFEPTPSTSYGQTYRSVDYEVYTIGSPPREYNVHWWVYGTHKHKKLLPQGQYTMAYLLNYYNDHVCVCYDGERMMDKRI